MKKLEKKKKKKKDLVSKRSLLNNVVLSIMKVITAGLIK